MNFQPEISIIVPVYNVEKYLKKCLDSIVNQTKIRSDSERFGANYEIIIINDGSKDGSLAIIEEYAKGDSRIKVIDKPNEGYGKTMNRGLDVAAGKYIGIVESDDWIEPDMYETLYALAEKHDVQVVKSNYYKYATTGGEKNKKECTLPANDIEQIINPKERSDIFYSPASIWSAIYRRDFLNKYKIRFLESPGASYQDVGFNFKVWAMADKVWFTSKALVHYRVDNENQSIKSKDKVFCITDEWENIERYMDDYPELKKASYQLRNHVKWRSYMWNLSRLENENREALRKRCVVEYKEAIRNGGIKHSCFTLKERLKTLRKLHPKSIGIRLAYYLQNITRIFISTKIRSEKKCYLVFFGLICIRKVDARHPMFLEGK